MSFSDRALRGLLGALCLALLLVGCEQSTSLDALETTADKTAPAHDFDLTPPDHPPAAASASATTNGAASDVDGRSVLTTEAIPGQYIVVFNDQAMSAAGATDLADRMLTTHGGDALFTYNTAIKGFAARLSKAAAEALSQDPHVALIEPDRPVYALGTQTNATWGLDRIDQRDLPLNSTYTYTPDGTGVYAFVIDTGIRTGHAEFQGRAQQGFDAFGGNSEDCNGHGTHVAGTVGGRTYGVAQNVNLVGVRVLNCSGSGSNSGVIAGVDWVTQQKQNNPSIPMVANMSLGGGASTALDNAI